uniref:MRT4 homolog, ribosome maturation factor n=1 Tax=Salarias fasciatus TaxID=181472 RepID=A0A672GE43_SALFA
MDPADTAAVRALKNKPPGTVGELRAILGLLSYYRQYIRDFSRIASPLYDMLKAPLKIEHQPKKGNQKQNNNLRKCVDTYRNLFIFSVENMRNNKLKDIRTAWKHSRFFFGKNKVMIVALGKGDTDEYKDNLHKVTRYLRGEVAILFTNKTKDESYLSLALWEDPAASAEVPSSEGTAPEVPRPELYPSVPGVETLLKDHQVCKEGDVLTPEQARILKLFAIEMAEFKVQIKCMWNSETSEFEMFAEEEPVQGEDVEEEDDDAE